jgi:5-(carboxyamino)imidazole ribonucleotide synthase
VSNADIKLGAHVVSPRSVESEITLGVSSEITLGVMGGGQLGRMFVHAAQRLGFRTAVLDADNDSPAGLVAHQHIQSGYLDERGLAQLAQSCNAITTEFENVPAAALRGLAILKPVRPSGDAVEVCQDRVKEKAHFGKAGVPCAPYAVIHSQDDLARVSTNLLPGILKTTQQGYDGKGQRVVNTAYELADAWQQLQEVPCVLEKKLELAFEISVIVARGQDGAMVTLPVQQNSHRNGILAITQVPAPDVSDAQSTQAIAWAKKVAESLRYVGVLCLELFVLKDGSLVANEMAPRPHNSGHYSIEACDVSQFELQVRTLAGLPLTPPQLMQPAVMINILGNVYSASRGDILVKWHNILGVSGARLHLYGKKQAREGRKMGHITVTAATAQEAKARALQCCEILGLEGF